MTNAYEIFTHFALILKSNKKTNCKYSGPMIQRRNLYRFSLFSVLWDGALPLAGKANPSANDIQCYKRFVRAVVFTHQAMAMIVTNKLHLMWLHVAVTMAVLRGLDKKREDWIEQGLQYDNKLRKQDQTTNQEVVAKAISGATHRD